MAIHEIHHLDEKTGKYHVEDYDKTLAKKKEISIKNKKQGLAQKMKHEEYDEKADDREVHRLVSRAMEKGKYRKY